MEPFEEIVKVATTRPVCSPAKVATIARIILKNQNNKNKLFGIYRILNVQDGLPIYYADVVKELRKLIREDILFKIDFDKEYQRYCSQN